MKLLAVILLLFPAIAWSIEPATRPATSPAPATVRADGVILIDGKPFFPIGIYHDSLDIGYYGQPFIDDMKTIADAGFNFADVSMDFTYDGPDEAHGTAAQVARLAEQRGLHLGVAVYLKNLDMVVRQQSQWPAILMSILGDDFNTDLKGSLKGPQKFPPDRLRALNRQSKSAAPHLLTYSSGSSFPGASLAGYESTVDCIGIQCYPVGDQSQAVRNELEAMQDRIANYWRLAGPHPNRCLIVNLQAFSSDKSRWPKPQEIRLQAWVTVMYGARGLVWYSFLQGDKTPLPKKSPDTWRELQQLVPELKRMIPYFTDAKLTVIPNPADHDFDDGPGTWHAALWEQGDTALLAIVNTNREQELDADFLLPNWTTPTTPFDEHRYPQTATFSNARAHIPLPPASTEIYLLKKSVNQPKP